MGELLSMDNILTGDEAANLFLDADPSAEEDTTTPEEGDKKENETTEVNSDDLFEEPESVGSEDKPGKKEDTTSSDEDGSSPNIYSSFATALKEEGIFPDLDDESIANIAEPEDFKEVVKQQIEAGLNEVQKRIYDALNAGVEPNEIKQYEQTLNFLDNITEELIAAENNAGEDLRRRLIQQDLLNRGYSQERSAKMTAKLFASGEDIEEAKQALAGNREFFEGKYNQILADAKKQADAAKAELLKRANKLKEDILTADKVFGNIPVDKNTRQKVYDNITKPVYRDKQTGEYYTAIQKYRMENEDEFIKNIGLLFTLTDGFSNLDKLIKPSTKREVKSKLKELESTLKGTNRIGENLRYAGGSDVSSLFDKGFSIDIN